jgi:MarR family transcriptional repressor of emrRAB
MSTRARQDNLFATMALGVNDRIRHAEEKAAGHGSAAPAALVALHEFLSGASIDQLGHVVGLTPSGAVRLVDKLCEAGLTNRGPGSDGRSRAVKLTRRGSDAARRVLEARRTASEAVLAGLSPTERENLMRLLERLLQELTTARVGERASSSTPPGGWLCRLCDFSACRRDEGTCPVASLTGRTAGRQPRKTAVKTGQDAGTPPTGQCTNWRSSLS